jgi:hypothetical protein
MLYVVWLVYSTNYCELVGYLESWVFPRPSAQERSGLNALLQILPNAAYSTIFLGALLLWRYSRETPKVTSKPQRKTKTKVSRREMVDPGVQPARKTREDNRIYDWDLGPQ